MAAPEFETRTSSIFVPPDERFPYTDFSDFGAHIIQAVANALIPTLTNLFDYAFESFEDVSEIYKRGLRSAYSSPRKLRQVNNPVQFIQGLLDDVKENNPLVNFSRPQVVECKLNIHGLILILII